jgi:hypothetical protein
LGRRNKVILVFGTEDWCSSWGLLILILNLHGMIFNLLVSEWKSWLF